MAKDKADDKPAPKLEPMRPLPEMAQRLTDVEKRVDALETKTDRPH